jgi:hypothetical protein
MSSIAVTCPAGVWTKITDVSKEGVLRIKVGGVSLTEQVEIPLGDISNTPLASSIIGTGEYATYTKVGALDFIYAWGHGPEDSVLDATPSDGAAL